MTEEHRKSRLTRLKALVEGQPELELKTHLRAIVAEIAELEAAAPPPAPERKAPESSNRKRKGGFDRGKD